MVSPTDSYTIQQQDIVPTIRFTEVSSAITAGWEIEESVRFPSADNGITVNSLGATGGIRSYSYN